MTFYRPPATSPLSSERSAAIAKSSSNYDKQWMLANVSQFKQLSKHNEPTRIIGLMMGRTEGPMRAKASENDISLRPTNQSPYNRCKP